MSKQKEPTIEPKKSNKRVQLKHVLLDVDFFDKPKIRALSYKFKKVSAAWLLHCYAQMSRASDAIIDRDCLEALALEWGISEFEELLKYCLKNGLILERENGFSNSRVEGDQESLARKRDESLERVNRHKDRYKRVNNALLTDQSRALKTRTPDTVTDTDTETDNLKITVPPTMGDASEALATWGRYMTETLRKPWGPIQAEALMMGYHGRTSELTRDIAHSMAAGWRTVKPAPAENETFQKKELKRPILTQHEKNMLVLQKFVEDEQNE